MTSSIFTYSRKKLIDGLIELGVLDESAHYEIDVTEVYYDPKTTEFVLFTASGCSCWDGEYSEERFQSLDNLKESLIKEERQYNPSFKGAESLLKEAEEAFEKYKNDSN